MANLEPNFVPDDEYEKIRNCSTDRSLAELFSPGNGIQYDLIMTEGLEDLGFSWFLSKHLKEDGYFVTPPRSNKTREAIMARREYVDIQTVDSDGERVVKGWISQPPMPDYYTQSSQSVY